MKLSIKKNISLVTAGLMFGAKLFAQTSNTTNSEDLKPFAPADSYRTWSVGVSAGLLSNYTLFHGKDDWNTQKVSLGYGAFVKKQILHGFGIQANFFKGQLEGSGPLVVNNIPTTPNASYKTDVNYAADISAVITLANINWSKASGSIQPYLSVGGGFMGYTPMLYTAAGTKSYFSTKRDLNELYIPAGIGLKFNISSSVNINLGYQVNFVNSDNVDGNNSGSSFDKISYTHIGLEFSIGKSKKPQLATHNPVADMRAEYTREEVALQNMIDAEKAKSAQLRSDLNVTNSNLAVSSAALTAINNKLSADADGDGVSDMFDKCPDTPNGVKVDGAGCPLPIVKPSVTIITEADKKIVKEAITNLEFDFGKATIRPGSLPSLAKVADLLVDKNFSLKLAGHTDNVGSADTNLMLSKNRAESIKTYLVSRGANASRIEAVGYGRTQPIASNKTEAGRQQNRRVEFTLF